MPAAKTLARRIIYLEGLAIGASSKASRNFAKTVTRAEMVCDDKGMRLIAKLTIPSSMVSPEWRMVYGSIE